ncbi:hypothetical protein HF086_015196 [Spodoptera exigua]|uniref:ABC transmembrane type-1 domain-containing protein n=1 Tax=Spodoptera exigua TaxID=7107 RepID=A0A922N033_SPOEX|nr:hypothetical protein HF086_015196 [Spodoptera exigua]
MVTLTSMKAWRYATFLERLVSVLGVGVGVLSSLGTIAGIVLYGELTALFVKRHTADLAPTDIYLLKLFGGGRMLDMEKFRGGVGEHVAMTANLAGTVLLGAALAVHYGWQLALAGLSVVPVSLAVAAVVAKYQTAWSGREVRAYGAAAHVVSEALGAVRTVRAYGAERLEAARYGRALAAAAGHGRARAAWAGAGAGLGWLLTYALNAIVFAYGAELCVRDMDVPLEARRYHPGVMVTVLFLTFMAAQNVAMCQPHLETFSAARGAARAIYRLLQRRSKINALESKGERPAKFRGDITFENLYFNYPSRPDVKVSKKKFYNSK